MGGLPALHSTYYVICLVRELRILLYPIYTGLASAPNFPEKALGVAVNRMIQQGSVCMYSALKFARFLQPLPLFYVSNWTYMRGCCNIIVLPYFR